MQRIIKRSTPAVCAAALAVGWFHNRSKNATSTTHHQRWGAVYCDASKGNTASVKIPTFDTKVSSRSCKVVPIIFLFLHLSLQTKGCIGVLEPVFAPTDNPVLVAPLLLTGVGMRRKNCKLNK